jgi:hypothetical protein
MPIYHQALFTGSTPAKPELLHHLRQVRQRLPEVMPRKGLVANPLCGFAYGNPAGAPQAGRGIGAESPVFCGFTAKNVPKFLKRQTKHSLKPRMPSALVLPKAEAVKSRLRGANAERARNPLAGASSRVCKAHFSKPKAQSKALLGYAGAERIETRWRALPAAYAKRIFQNLRHGVKPYWGMLPRSGF